MAAKYPLTVAGAEKLREELQQLKSVARPTVILAIADARAHGDLKENAEYHAAKEQQSFIEGRIAEIEGKLSNSQIIDVLTLNANGRVVFGATVDLIETEQGGKVTYRIVGDDEADIKSGLLSVNAPIARALIGKEQSDFVVVRTPGGEKEYEIAAVRYV